MSRPVLRGGGGGNTASLPGDAYLSRAGQANAAGYTTLVTATALAHPWAVMDADGNRTAFQYDDNHNMERLTRTLGSAPITTSFRYDDGNHLTRMTDSLSFTTTYGYYDSGLLAATTDARGHTTEYGYYTATGLLRVVTRTVDSAAITTSYGYDLLGRTITTTDALGHRAVTRYDAWGRVVLTVQNWEDGEYDADHPDQDVVTRYGYDALGRQVRVTNTLAVVTGYEYDQANRLVRTVQNCVGDGQFDPDAPGANVTTRYGYDAVGHQVRVTDTYEMVTRTDYDDWNRALTVTVNYTTAGGVDPNLYNITTTYGYNDLGQVVTTTDDLGQRTVSFYDRLGHVTMTVQNWADGEYEPAYPDEDLITSYAYDALGRQVTVTNPLGMVTVSGYDQLDRLLTQTVNYTTTTPNPDPTIYNLVTTYGYDAAGNRVTVTDPLLVQTVTAYDELNRLQQVTQNYQAPGTYNAEYPDRNVFTRYEYDALGRQSAVSVLGQYTTTYGFDGLGRTVAITDPLTHTTHVTYDGLGRRRTTIDANNNATSYGYDALGRTVAVTDALTHTTRYAFDGLGRRTLITDAAGIVTRYQHDLLGRLITVTENYSSGPVDEQTNVQTVYGYDPLGNRVYVVNARGYTTTYEYDDLSRLIRETDPANHTWAYRYDALGRQIVITDPLTVTTRTYDALGRLRQVEYGDTVSVTYAYNALGSRTAMTDATGVTQYLYDDLGRVLLLTHTVDAAVAYTVGYGYDGRGLRTLLVYPDGTRVTSTYDLAGRLVAVDGVTTTYAIYDYDPGNRLISATLGNGVRTAYAYDAGDRLLAISHTLDGDLLARFVYEYNAAGRRTRAVETVVAPDLDLGVFGEELTPPTATVPAAAFHVYLPLAPREPGPAVAARPGPAGVGAPLPFDPTVGPGGGAPPGRPGGPIVRTQKAFRAAFDEQGLRYTPTIRLVETSAYHVDWRLTQVRSGQTKLFQPGTRPNPPSSPPGQPDRVRYDRGDYFREEYVVTEGGVEQRFVFPRPFAVAGDLEIEGNLLGNLELVLQDSGEIAFLTPAGDVVSSYGQALVEDGCGERLVAQLELTGRHLRIVVPRDWLARACFPVVVDPLIGPNFAVSTQPLSGNQQAAAVAYNGAGRYLVAYHGAGNGSDVFAQVLSTEGMLVSGTIPLDTRPYDQQNPDVAGNTTDHQFLVAWQGTTGLPVNWDIYAQRVYSDGRAAGGRITVYSGSYDQQYPAAAYNGNDGQYLVVWQSRNTSTGVYGLYGQVVAADGTLSGTATTLYTATAPLAYPDVTFNVSDTQYLVVWQQYDPWVTGWDVRGQIVASGGTRVGSAFNIAAGANDQTVPAVTYSVSDTQYLVAWQHYAGANDLNDVRGCWVGGTGCIDPAFGVATGSDDQRAPDAACGGNGECLVAWERQPNPGTTYWDVYARRVNGSGTVGSAFTVSAATNDQRYPAVAYSPQTNEYLPAWQDYRSGSNWDVYAQRVDADGAPDGAEVLVSAQPNSYAQEQPAAAYGSNNGYHLVVWRDSRSGSGDVYGQLVTGGGALVGPAWAIASETSYVEQSPVVAYDPQDDVYLVAWARRLPPMQNDDWNIYAQRVAGDGDLVGNALALCTAKGDQTAPAVAYNADSGYFLVTWEDTRDGGYDVYARAVSGTNGSLVDAFAVYTGDYDQRYPDVAADPASGEYLVVWQHGSKNGADVYGQRTLPDRLAGDAFTITTAANDQQQPAVAWSAGRAEYLVVWAHGNGANDDVHGRRVGADGDLLGDEITVTSGTAEQQYPDVAANGAGGGWTVAWQEGASSPDVHARSLDGTGLLLGGEETLAAAANAQERPALSYDDNRGQYLAVWADYRHAGSGPDVYGQLHRDYTVVVAYRYDPLSRLVKADYSTGVAFGYAYDKVGNRTSLTTTTLLSGTIVTTYEYDGADRLITVTRAGAATTYTWNDRGDLLDDGRQEYAWDAAGRLVGVSVTGGPAVAYVYDGSNDRTAMVVAGVTTTYVVDPYNPVDYLPQVLVEETAGAATRNLYGLDLLAQVGSTMTTYLGYDALSVRLRLDEDGSLVDAYRYGPFGEELGAGPSGYGFAGERWDESVGLLYLRARYYAPEVGRFVSRDPYPGEHLQPQNLNRFVYVTNNAVNLVDASGLKGMTPWYLWLGMLLAPPSGSHCRDDWPEDWEFDLWDPRVREWIELNFDGGGDVDAYYSAWVDHSGMFNELEPSPFPFNLNRYDKYFSGWTDLFNDLLVPWGQELCPDVIKAMAMRESKMGLQLRLPDESDNPDGIMQVTDQARPGIRWAPRFYIRGLGNEDDLRYDPSLAIAAGARYYFLQYEATKYNWLEAAYRYNGGGDPHYRERVSEVMFQHVYSYYVESPPDSGQYERCWLCVGPLCEGEHIR